ncbi:Gfo/Idh/MocA family oxidoreductase [candidate division KSB1 bacterium]|nr:Gfo/Idh/MocA family oxidoreductase [candidate division KSB1 bacterium]
MKAAVIGCGNISHFHIHAIRSNPFVELVALCDANEKILDERANQYQVTKRYTKLDEMLDKENPDALHILTPPHSHSELAVSAMDRGIHVLVEKPMTVSTTEADEMIQISRKKNVKLCINHSALFTPVVTRAIEYVNSFAFGSLVHVECHFGFDVTRVLNTGQNEQTGPMSWYGHLKGHILEDLLPHPVSIVMGFLRQYSNSYCIVKDYKKQGYADELRLLLDSQKVTATVSVSLRSHPSQFKLYLYGTKMSLIVDVGDMGIVRQKMYKLPKAVARGVGHLSESWQIFRNTIGLAVGVALKKVDNAAGVGILIDKFYNSLKHGWPVPVSGEEGKIVVELAEKIWS